MVFPQHESIEHAGRGHDVRYLIKQSDFRARPAPSRAARGKRWRAAGRGRKSSPKKIGHGGKPRDDSAMAWRPDAVSIDREPE